MKKKNVTIKDIAGLCNVSPTVVSAALRKSKGRVAYSEETRSRIVETAKKLNYRPNLMARSMVSGKIPIVAYALHFVPKDITGKINYYIQNNLPNTAFALNRLNFEMIFIPYSSEDEQIERIQTLLEFGIISGVITNIIPWAHKKIISYLKKQNVPYVIRGYDLGKNIHSVYINSREVWDIVTEYAKNKNCDDIYNVGIFRGDLNINKYPFPGTSHFSAPILDLNDIDFEKNGSLFICSGQVVAVRLLEERKIRADKILVVENISNAGLVQDMNAILVNPESSSKALVEYSVNSIVKWVNEDKVPEIRSHEFLIGRENIINSGLK